VQQQLLQLVVVPLAQQPELEPPLLVEPPGRRD
jgi:hypothetical protein